MEENGTKVLSKQQPQLPKKIIIPEEIDLEFEQFHEYGPKMSEAHIFNELKQTNREDESPLEIESLPAVTNILKETAEGQAIKLIYQKDCNKYSQEECFIELKDNKLCLFEAGSIEGKLIHEFEFPHGAEYRFDEKSDEKRMIITDIKG